MSDAWTMAAYLPQRRADYNYTLSFTPHDELPMEGSKSQAVYELDNKRLTVVPISNTTSFDVELSATHLPDASVGTLLDLYHTQSKANGSQNTFYWTGPLDSEKYVVRFIGTIKHTAEAGYVGYQSVEFKLRVEAVYAVVTTTTTTTSTVSTTTSTTSSTLSTTSSTLSTTSSSSTTTTTPP